tara:strand:- start:359 stop:580 length:222 start_codon:yes stop_codon:yes gene_type:complete
MEHWVKTKDAVKLLGIPADTLKRNYANKDKGFLVEGKHWKRGMYHNSSKYWDINACKDMLLQQGFMITKPIEY